MADVLIELRSLKDGFSPSGHDLLSGPTFSVGLIQGGVGVNIVPEQWTVTHDRWTLPHERQGDVLAELDGALDNVCAAGRISVLSGPSYG